MMDSIAGRLKASALATALLAALFAGGCSGAGVEGNGLVNQKYPWSAAARGERSMIGTDGMYLFNNIQSHPDVSYGEEGSDNALLVIQKGSRFGFGDAKGNVVIEPQYQGAFPFHEGLAAVKKDGLWGYIDGSGAVVLPFRYYDACPFRNGKAFVATGLIGVEFVKRNPDVTLNLTCSLIDKTGRELRQADYSNIAFSDGMYRIHGNDNVFYYLDADGNELFHRENPDPYGGENYSAFAEGLARAYDAEFHYIDRTGRQAFPGGYFSMTDFSDGLAAVAIVPKDKPDVDPFISRQYGYIDRKGNLAVEPAYMEAFPFGEGLAVVQKPDRKWVIIDKTGKETSAVQERNIVEAAAFREGLCAISDPFYWGYMDISGKTVIGFQYTTVSPFINGIAEVYVDGHIGYIDKTGQYVWEPK